MRQVRLALLAGQDDQFRRCRFRRPNRLRRRSARPPAAGIRRLRLAAIAAADRACLDCLGAVGADLHMVENGRMEIDRCLGPLNDHLAGREWIVDHFSIADISIAATLGFAAMIGVDLGKYPNVAAWVGRIRERASWKKVYA